MNTITLKSIIYGQQISFLDEIKASGAMKDVYFSPDRSYVVGFFRDNATPAQKDRLTEICTRYRTNIFERPEGGYWTSFYRWPYDLVERDGKLGVVVPFYEQNFFFAYGSTKNDSLGIKGKEKEGKWFASASNRAKFLDPREKGDWLTHLQICLQIARAVRRMHMAGLAHSDLSYKNVLVDPVGGKACVIDIDGLVVPTKYPPDVSGTPDFVAPEVIRTQHLDRQDRARSLPSQQTDRHALAVLIYMYLFYRHPLRGGKAHDADTQRDEEMSMGEKALFVEHPTDRSNRVNLADQKPEALPWADPKLRPYTMAGPYLKALFDAAFIHGLHAPAKRPTASDWEDALIKTIDLIQPCSAKCEMGWYVFDNSRAPSCPHCGTSYKGKLPVINLYSQRHKGSFHPDGHRLMVWDGQSLFEWHAFRHVSPNEHLTPEQKKRVGYFQRRSGEWLLVNERLAGMKNISTGAEIPPGQGVRLDDGLQILLSNQENGRLVVVQMAGSSSTS